MTAWMNVHRAACTQNRQGIRWSFGNENMIKPPLGPPSGHQATGGKNSKLMRSDKQLRYSFACLDGGMATDATGTAHLQPFSCQHPIQQIVDQNGPKQGGLDPTLTYYITKKKPYSNAHLPQPIHLSTYPGSGSSDRCIKNSMKDMRLSAVISVMSP